MTNQKTTRPPVVAVLGHIDHGKSSLLEAIRDFGITEGESGGITQHIGAYQVEEATFIDTPGHQAFSAMRSRGAQVADIAILVVAADEGVKDQTEEAINFIEEAGVPMIVAINKMDKEKADANKVKRQLAECGVEVEERGGEIPSVELSAETGDNVDELLEVIALVAEMEDLKADPSARAEGVIIESYLDSQQGPLATILLRQGTLEAGDLVATNSTFGTIKNMQDSQGERLEKIEASQPALMLGFSEVPQVGEKVYHFEEQEEAKEFIEEEERKRSIEAGEGLNAILKVDVQGSIEAIEQVLEGIPQEKIDLKLIKKEVGDISEADVRRAQTV
ncbi:MAG: translation initiation factor IF-2, partial [Candidatus Paceibacterota bacterium]